MITKICCNPNCIHQGTPQPISNFHKDKSTTDGYERRCKDCIRAKNKKYLSENREENKKSCKIRAHSKAKYDSWFDKLSKYEECRRDPDNPELLQVKCKNSKCTKIWFNPTNQDVGARLRGINGTIVGEYYLYCSQECKNECLLYRMTKDPYDNQTSVSCRSEILQDELRELVLARDNYTCQNCGKSQKEFPNLQLICHHVIPVKVDPGLASDMGNCKTLCEDCHKEAHNIPGCTFTELAQL